MQVLGATVSGVIGPWIIGWIFGTATGFKGGGLRGAMGNGVSTGTAWVSALAACVLGVLESCVLESPHPGPHPAQCLDDAAV